MDTGTGQVHIAPGHGEEDYDLGRSLGLKIYNPVDDDGRFVGEVEHVVVVEEHGAARWVVETHQQREQSRLAAADRAE